MPAHRGEVAGGEPAELFRRAVLGRGLSRLREGHWGRDPVPRALVTRDNGPKCGIPVPEGRDVIIPAEDVLDDYAKAVPPGVEILLCDVRGRELRLRRVWDRFEGVLADGVEDLEVSVPVDRLWERLGPLFHGEAAGAVTLVAGPEVSAPMLMMRVHDRYRSDAEMTPVLLDQALERVRKLEPVDGHFLVFTGRSEGTVQMMWRGGPKTKPPETFPEDRRERAAELRREGPRLWLETPFPEERELHGRFVTIEEAERMVAVLAAEDRVAVHELGDLEMDTW